MASLHSKIHTLCDHEPFPGRAVLQHSPNRKAGLYQCCEKIHRLKYFNNLRLIPSAKLLLSP